MVRPCAFLASLIIASTSAWAADAPAKPTTQPKSAPAPAAPAKPATQPEKSAKEIREEELRIIHSTSPGAPTPELLLRKVADAWKDRDAKRYVSCLDQSDNDLRVMAKAAGLRLEMTGAREELTKAMEERYGKDTPEPDIILGLKLGQRPPEFMDAVVKYVDALKVEVKGEQGIVHGIDSLGRLIMIRQKGVWYIDHSRATLAARVNEETVVRNVTRDKAFLDTYRAGLAVIDDCRTLEVFKTKFRTAATRTLEPLSEMNRRVQEERRRN